MNRWHRSWRLTVLLIAFGGTGFGQTTGPAPIAGTSWQLVRFQGGDGTVLTPDDGSKYTLSFAADGTVAARVDCNRGRGVWASAAPGRLEFGPLALTRAYCGPQPMHDHIVKQWANIRSYILKDGHLFLSLVADGGIYEFAPAPSAAATAPAAKSPVTYRGPVTFSCSGMESLRATFYQTKPALALLQRGGDFKPAFQVEAASGTRYEGDGVILWEASGEATLNWMGAGSICKRN